MSAGEITIVAVGFVCMSHGLSLVLSLLALRSRGTLGEIDDLVGGMQGSSRALLFVTLGLAPAIAEELLFRGLIQQSLLRPLGAAGAIGVASLAFGAVHLDAAQSSAAFVLGLYLGTALEAGGSLPVTILCHAINNSLALLGSLSIDGASAVAEAEAAASGLKYALAAASLLSLGVGLLAFVVRRQSEARAADASTTPPGDPALPPLPPP